MPRPPQHGTLHIYLDESGDLNFTNKGTPYYIFAAVWTYDPAPLAGDLAALRFRLLKQGKNIERFHATDDDPKTRELVIERLARFPAWRFATVVVEKRKVPPAGRDPMWRFYSHFASVPLRFILRGPFLEKAHKVLIFTDSFPHEVKQKREMAEKAIKTACRVELSKPMPRMLGRNLRLKKRIREDIETLGEALERAGIDVASEPQPPAAPHPSTEAPSLVADAPIIPFCVYHHSSASNLWLQIADYCAWAIRRKWEVGDSTLFSRLKRRLAAPEWDILRSDTTTYY